jgi:hypothetical protein
MQYTGVPDWTAVKSWVAVLEWIYLDVIPCAHNTLWFIINVAKNIGEGKIFQYYEFSGTSYFTTGLTNDIYYNCLLALLIVTVIT